jgi:hypothetical protein
MPLLFELSREDVVRLHLERLRALALLLLEERHDHVVRDEIAELQLLELCFVAHA